MSSSSEEEYERLRDALVPGFTIDAVQKQNQYPSGAIDNISRGDKKIPLKKSLRKQRDNEVVNKDFRAVDITPEQQNFIARQLAEYLESQIVEKDILSKKWAKHPTKLHRKGGIKLLSSSKRHLKYNETNVVESVDLPRCKPELLKHREIDDSTKRLSESEKLREATVSPEWILQGQGVFGKLSHRGDVITGAVHAWDTKKSSSDKAVPIS